MKRALIARLLIVTGGIAITAAPALAQDAERGAADTGSVADAQANEIGTVRVTAAGEGSSTPGTVPSGANGSSDPTATEGTRSYAPTKVNIGGKVPVEVKDVPQTVSVITRQLIEDQHLNTLTDVLEFTPGVTVLQRFGADQFSPSFFSRGFEIRNFQIDGGAPINYGGDNRYTSSLTPVFDMSKYDHVEVLRGAGGAFTGTGDPGGVLSLERKRPTDAWQLLGELGVESFNAFRASADLSTPLTSDGALKVRGVLTHDERDYFYRVADKALDMAYLNFEFRPSGTTRFNLGGSYTEQGGVPFGSGLPRFTNGSDIRLPRDTCLCLAFGNFETREVELFGQFEHHFSNNWSINANLTRNHQKSRRLEGRVVGFGGIDPATNEFDPGANIFAARQSTRSKQDIADIFLTGRFMLFGREQNLVFGVNYQKQDDKATPRAGDGQAFFPDTNVNIFTFDPNAFDLPEDAAFMPLGGTVIAQNRLQLAAYGTLRLEPLKGLHIDLAARYNHYKTDQRLRTDAGGGFFFDQNKIFKEGKLLPAIVAVSYETSSNMSVYASYAGIYQSQATELTADGSSLPAVRGSNIEIGVKRTDFQGKLTSTLSLYRIVQRNLSVTDPNFPFSGDPAVGTTCCYLPADRNRSKGFDIEVTGALFPRLQVTFSYTHNINKFDPGEISIASGFLAQPLVTQAPKDLVKLFTAYRLGSSGIAGRVTVGGGGRLQSKTTTRSLLCDINGCAPLVISQPSYGLLDLFTRVVITPQVTVQLNANNLLDKRYFATIGSITGNNYYGEPRSFSATLRSKF